MYQNLFRLRKQIIDTTVNNIKNLSRLKNENKAIKNRVIRDAIESFEHEGEEKCYKQLSTGNF